MGTPDPVDPFPAPAAPAAAAAFGVASAVDSAVGRAVVGDAVALDESDTTTVACVALVSYSLRQVALTSVTIHGCVSHVR